MSETRCETCGALKPNKKNKKRFAKKKWLLCDCKKFVPFNKKWQAKNK